MTIMSVSTLLIMSILVNSLSSEPLPTRHIFEQIAERLFLLQKEYELLMRQFNRIATGAHLQRQALVEDVPSPAVSLDDFNRVARELENSRQIIDVIYNKMRLSSYANDDNASPQAGSGDLGLGTIMNLVTGSFSPSSGNPLAALGQFTQIFSGLTNQLQALTGMLGGLSGGLTSGLVRTGSNGDSSAGGNPLEAIMSTLSGLTSSLSGLTNMFRGIGK